MEIVPGQLGWFKKRGTDWYAFVYLDCTKQPINALFVKEQELWDYMNAFEHKYPERIMQNAKCSLVPVKDFIPRCPSACQMIVSPDADILCLRSRIKTIPLYDERRFAK